MPFTLKSYLLSAAGVLLLLAYFRLSTFSPSTVLLAAALHLAALAYITLFLGPEKPSATRMSDFFQPSWMQQDQRYSGFGISSIRDALPRQFGPAQPDQQPQPNPNNGSRATPTNKSERIKPLNMKELNYLGFGAAPRAAGFERGRNFNPSSSPGSSPFFSVPQNVRPNAFIFSSKGVTSMQPDDAYMKKFQDLERRVNDSLRGIGVTKPKFDGWMEKARVFIIREISIIYHEELNRLSKINRLLMANYHKSLLEFSRLVESTEHEHLPFDDVRSMMLTLKRQHIQPDIGRGAVCHKQLLELIRLTTEENHIDRLMRELNCEGDRTEARMHFFTRLGVFVNQQKKPYTFVTSQTYPCDNEILLRAFRIILKGRLDLSLHPTFCHDFELPIEFSPKVCIFASEKHGLYKHFSFHNQLHREGLRGYVAERNAYSMITYYLIWLNTCCVGELELRDNKPFLDVLNMVLREYH